MLRQQRRRLGRPCLAPLHGLGSRQKRSGAASFLLRLYNRPHTTTIDDQPDLQPPHANGKKKQTRNIHQTINHDGQNQEPHQAYKYSPTATRSPSRTRSPTTTPKHNGLRFFHITCHLPLPRAFASPGTGNRAFAAAITTTKRETENLVGPILKRVDPQVDSMVGAAPRRSNHPHRPFLHLNGMAVVEILWRYVTPFTPAADRWRAIDHPCCDHQHGNRR